MEQITTGINVDLPTEEKKNVFLAITVGCLNTIHNSIPGPPHQRQKRVLRDFAQQILSHVSKRIPKVEEENIELFNATITASASVMDHILEETGQQGLHVMLNLAGFCMDKLPLTDWHHKKYNSLFDMWIGADKYEDAKSGERIFHRIESEVKILVAQRGGIIL
jgi:hypothetical protein